MAANGSVGIGTRAAPTSTLQVAGTTAVGVVLGIPGGTGAGTALAAYAGSYLGLNPTDGSSDNYCVLPAPASCVGRVYYLRNNNAPFGAYVGTAGGSIFPARSSTAITAGNSYRLEANTAPKTVIAISDGLNWTLGYINEPPPAPVARTGPAIAPPAWQPGAIAGPVFLKNNMFMSYPRVGLGCTFASCNSPLPWPSSKTRPPSAKP